MTSCLPGALTPRRARLFYELIRIVEFFILGQMRNVPCVDHERGLHRWRFDPRDSLPKRPHRVRVGGFVKSDMTVADLNEGKFSGSGRCVCAAHQALLSEVPPRSTPKGGLFRPMSCTLKPRGGPKELYPAVRYRPWLPCCPSLLNLWDRTSREGALFPARSLFCARKLFAYAALGFRGFPRSRARSR